MNTFYKMILKQFYPVFLIALLFFVLILQLVDLFTNLWKYLDNDAAIKDILLVSFYYFPKCISYSLPISLLFSISYTLGILYTNNELIMVFGSGVPLWKFILPFIVTGVLLSVGSFYFEENIVIDSFKQKNSLSRVLLNQSVSFSNTNVTVLTDNNRVIYYADYYNDNNKTLSGLIVFIREADKGFSKRIDAEYATWKEGEWELINCRVFKWDEKREYINESNLDRYTDPILNEPPSTFRKTARNVDEMPIEEALEWIDSLKKAGLPVREALTSFYKRFSFSLTPFIVSLLSAAIGGSFKKNILLMSLLSSLVVSVLFYVLQMVTVIFANLGYISPLSGAFSPFFIFLVSGLWAFRFVKT